MVYFANSASGFLVRILRHFRTMIETLRPIGPTTPGEIYKGIVIADIVLITDRKTWKDRILPDLLK